eukprot:CAMPEP_0172089110 /NCGR_PEP_ID=MMETSP1043-20130122/23615_1 /TAXON_ID=464988 /ORGANISM="Hemiselmis andersenii, Strain CCMP441" /LENGTH=160 /DNA_ID=CAMNT_0012751505 /DNA_START=20 /DNA_END=503 /DNA_ORIENTATION=-
MVLCSAAATSTVARRMAMNMPQRQDSNDAEAGNEQDPANGCLTELCHPAYVLQELDTDKEQQPSLNASINPIVSLSPVPMLDPIKRAAMTPMKLLLELMRFAVTAFQMGSPDLIKMAKSLSSWGSSCTRTDADTTQPSEPCRPNSNAIEEVVDCISNDDI